MTQTLLERAKVLAGDCCNLGQNGVRCIDDDDVCESICTGCARLLSLAPDLVRALERARNHAMVTIKRIEDDDRFHYEPANILANAPLALIQVAMKAKHEEATSNLNAIEAGEEVSDG